MLTALLVALLASPDSLSKAERALVSHVDGHRQEAVRLLERIVNLNSGTLNLDGVRQVGDLLRSEFDALGFRTRWIDGAPFKRAGHLVAEHPGRGPRILLIGHLDTVFEPDSPFQNVHWIDSVTARGPGIIDMKGGDVIIVQALKALAAGGLLEGLHVTVIMTGDEEDPGEPVSLALRMFDGAARPTALVAASDTQAVGALEAARLLGLRVPEDVSVVGYDDIEIAEVLGLTTVRQPLEHSGRRGAELLLKQLREPGVAPVREVLPTELVRRRTTAQPPG